MCAGVFICGCFRDLCARVCASVDLLGFSSSGLCDKKEVKFDRTDIFGGEGFVQVLLLLF